LIIPSITYTVPPALTIEIPLFMVLKGDSIVPELLSEPFESET